MAIFNASAMTNNYAAKLQQAEQPYQSRYQNMIDATLNDIINRKPFEYDFNADPLYQQYRSQYTALGDMAMKNTVAQVNANTGGYANSYSVSAGLQANQQYLDRLNDVIPELYNAAINKYQMEGNELNNRFSVLTTADDREYNRWNDNRNYYQSAYSNSYGRDYQTYRDAVADDQWNKQYALSLSKKSKGGNGGDSSASVDLNSEIENTVNFIKGRYGEKSESANTYINNYLYKLYTDGKISKTKYKDLLEAATESTKYKNETENTYGWVK